MIHIMASGNKERRKMKENKNVYFDSWIKVEKKDGTIAEVSLKDIFENSQNYTGLYGEVLLQDFAVLRNPILAIMYTAYERYDLDGKPRNGRIRREDAFKEIRLIWENGHLPVKMLTAYMDTVVDRFWLFDEKNPWMQVVETEPTLKVNGKEHSGFARRKIKKLVGDVFESDEKRRILSYRTIQDDDTLDYKEALRWMLFLNVCDDHSYSPRGNLKNGYFSYGNFVMAKGSNLFETIMLNFNPFGRQFERVLTGNKPEWEKPVLGRSILDLPQPDNLAALMSFRFRRMRLETNNDRVTGYKISGHHHFDLNNFILEPHILWKKDSKENGGYVFKKVVDQGKMWRDFSTLFLESESQSDSIVPGVVLWIEELKKRQIIPEHFRVVFETGSVEFGSMSCGIKNLSNDHLSIYTSLFENDKGQPVERIIHEVASIEKLAKAAGMMEKNIALACGDRNSNNAYARGVSDFFDRVDGPFRMWLQNIDIEREDFNDMILELHQILYQVTDNLIREKRYRQTPTLLIGRSVKDKGKKAAIRVSLPETILNFQLTRKKYIGNKMQKENWNE